MNLMRLNILAFLFQIYLIKPVTSEINITEESIFKENGEYFALNQLGFLIAAPKLAVVSNLSATSYEVINFTTGSTVFYGNLSEAQVWKEADQTVKIADFSQYNVQGEYQLKLSSGQKSRKFRISNNIFKEPFKASMKYYYFSRSGAALHRDFAGKYERPPSHPDNIVLIHESASSERVEANSFISSSKGWFDAGDFNKYIVSSTITTHTLLKTFAHFEPYLKNFSLNIPESSNKLPDFVDEILWNLEWMLTMQDSDDGGVYHKLTTQNYSDYEMPHTQFEQRYVVQKSTSATLGFAATFAYAARVLLPYNSLLPTSIYHYKRAAENAWNWSMQNPDMGFVQPDGFLTGVYAGTHASFVYEKLWAATEMYLLTGKDVYKNAIVLPTIYLSTPDWDNVDTLAVLSLVESDKTPSALKEAAFSLLYHKADSWVYEESFSGYRVAMSDMYETNFKWGSNGYAMYKAMVFLRLNRLVNNKRYYQSAVSLIDYVFGRNPTGYSFVTGFGYKTPMDVHHRVSIADNITDPIPGMLVGGPHAGFQDKSDCEKVGVSYTSDVTAMSYVDHWCSYATNEVAINWNAPLVYNLLYLDQV